jgi:drug/metabolite transporter (DMT)-like permease
MSDPQLGQLLALLSTISFAGGNVFILKGARGSGDNGVLFSVLVTMVLSCALWLLLEREDPGAGNYAHWWRGIAWFVAAGIFAMVFGRTLLYASIRYLGVARSSSVKRLSPFFSVLLAWLFLGEAITGWDSAGMLAIAAAFVMLLFKSRGGSTAGTAAGHAGISYLWGVGSALAYAFAHIARKFGLMDIDAPVFGTMISAVSGFICFLIAAMFLDRYRHNLRRIFTNLNRWLVLAAFSVSAGQILQFAALYYEKVSTVVMITSLEIFISMFLSVVIFRAEQRPDARVIIAAVAATAGVMAIAMG